MLLPSTGSGNKENALAWPILGLAVMFGSKDPRGWGACVVSLSYMEHLYAACRRGALSYALDSVLCFINAHLE